MSEDNPKNDHLLLIPFYLFYISIVLLTMKNSFFWDTIQLGSKHAHWYYENNFKYILLPDSIDSGHFPVFGMALALVWKIFGKSLIASHIFMLPFLVGIVFQTYRLSAYFFNSKWKYVVMVILLIDPTILSQSVLVTPDIPLLFFLLLLFNSIIFNNKILLIFSSVGLSSISLRGTMLCILMAIFVFIVKTLNGEKKFLAIKQVFIVFLPSGIITLAYMLFHYFKKGWIGYHPESPWAQCFEKVSLQEFLYNTGIYIWRLIDFGRVFVWVVLLFLFLSVKKLKPNSRFQFLLVINMLLIVVFPITMLLHKHLLAHRYLIPVFYFFSLFVLYFLFQVIESPLKKVIVIIFIVLGLISGNFWKYPDGISTGWDSTLAHLPYYSLRKKMIDYIRFQKIPFDKVGSGFPNLAKFKYTDMTSDQNSFLLKDLNSQQYIFYSNIFNDFTDSEIDELKDRWILEKEYRYLQVKVQLYRNPGMDK